MPRRINTFNGSFRARCVVLLALALSGRAIIATAQSSSTFTTTGSMTRARSQHTATLLPNGKVLIAGGAQWTLSGAERRDCYVPNVGCILASAELFDPGPGTFSRTGNMTTARRMHTATLLADGRILIAGGYGMEGAVASAELYDPSTGTFTATRNMMTPRGGHSAILLPNGNVLMVGGYGAPGYPDLAPAELYDPISGTFSAGGAYVGRGGCDFCAPATLLADGTVLFPGQHPAQIYDPVTNTFSVAGMMMSDPSTAALLLNGKVLFAGGEDLGRSSSAELYDPVRGTFTSTGNMARLRVWHTLNLLPNGMVLTTGGETDSGGSIAGSDSAELYDPSAGIFLATGKMAAARESHTATLLNDGRVLIAGGVSWRIGIFPGALLSAELYTPHMLIPAPALVSLSGEGRGQGRIFHAGTSHIAEPDDPAATGEDLDIYCTGLRSDSVIPPQVAIGGRLATVVWFGNALDGSGMSEVRIRVPAGIAAGPGVPVRMIYIGRPSNEVTIAVQP